MTESTFPPHSPEEATKPGAVDASGATTSASPQPTPDTGLIGLVMLARFHSVAADADQLAHDYREAGKPFGIPQILLAAKHLGLKAKLTRTDQSRLARTPLRRHDAQGGFGF